MRQSNLARVAWIVVIGNLLIAMPAKADDAGANASAKKAIQTVLDQQVAAWNRSDLDGFMAGYWKSPDLTFSSGNTKLKGWQATFDRYKQRYQSEGREMGKLDFSELEIELLGPDSRICSRPLSTQNGEGIAHWSFHAHLSEDAGRLADRSRPHVELVHPFSRELLRAGTFALLEILEVHQGMIVRHAVRFAS